MDFRYARPQPPPPPPSSDPHQPPQQQQPVPPPPGSWFSGQFQYHAPSPPPPQWAPQPQHSDHHLPPPPPPPSYAAAPPPPMPYPSNPYSLPPRPHMLPPQPQPHYPTVNQEWSNTNWGHQGWDYSAHNKNEDDWAARARAWAASKAVADDQRQHSQLVPANRPEEMNYQDQYSQNFDPSYPELQQHSLPPTSTYQQYSSSVAPPPRMPANHLQEQSFSSGYASDGHFSYAARDGNLRDTAAAYPHQETTPTSLSVHQQEVPSSYSSVAGKEELRDVNGKFYQQSHGPFTSAPQHQIQQQISPNNQSISSEHPSYVFNNSSADPTTDLSNQPLDFGPPYGQPKYGHESDGPSHNAWTSSAPPGIPYPSIPPIHPAGQQADPSSLSMHTSPLFGGRISTFQPTMPSANTTFPIGTSNAFHGDTYGFPERPKKASVPNWLREEIIKKKAVIGSSAPEVSRQENDSNEDEVMDRSLRKDHLDGKSIESSRSTEEEDDDEEDVEAARSAAINQEIKRILTEVLLKVTDELFDEIATKVLDEDDVNVEVERKAIASGETPKSSAKVIIPAKTKGTDVDDVSGKSSSSTPGDVLGLGSYASDDDDDEEKEIENSSIPSSKSSNPTVHSVENGSSQVEEKKSCGVSPNGAIGNHGAKEPHNDNSGGDKVKQVSSNVSKSKQSAIEGGVNAEYSLPDDSRDRSPKSGPEDKSGKKRRSSSKDHREEVESGKDTKVDENKTHDERHIKRAKKEDQNGSKERIHGDSGKRSSKGEVKDDKEERERDRRSRGKEDGRKRERGKDDKKEGPKYKSVGDSSRHHSPSPGGRGRSSKDNSIVTHAYASTDTSSDDSRRKVHSKRRNLSKSPVRSRRQVSRSPPSKRSQHRHSIYSSLETTRERKRSRSRSRRG